MQIYSSGKGLWGQPYPKSASQDKVSEESPIQLPEERKRDVLANRIWIMRKFLADMNCIEAMELLQNRMNKYGTNVALLQNMDKDDM